MAKGGFNLLGQGVVNSVQGEARLDLLGLGADMILTPGAGTLVGSFSEGGVNLSDGSGYFTPSKGSVGIAKIGIGFGFGAIGGNLTKFLGANGVSKAMQGFGEGVLKVYEEMFNLGAESLAPKNK